MEIIIGLIIAGVIFGFIGMAIGDMGNKRNGPAGFILGFLLGPLGCVVAAVIPASDADGAPVKEAAPDRIAKLEAELAALKKQPGTKAVCLSVDEDSGIPTYKLD